MNCKPGDLAIVSGKETLPHLRGRIVTVARCGNLYGIPHWQTEPKFIDRDGVEVWFADEDLRPIRDPGDDATDETLLWLPSPSREKEEA
jgi:hypothetical protein